MPTATPTPPIQLSHDAAMIYRAATAGRPARSRDLRRRLPRPLSRRAFARAWVELVSLDLVKTSAGGEELCHVGQ